MSRRRSASTLAISFFLAGALPLAAGHAVAGALGSLAVASASANDRPTEVTDAAPPTGALAAPSDKIVEETDGPLLPGPDATPPKGGLKAPPAIVASQTPPHSLSPSSPPALGGLPHVAAAEPEPKMPAIPVGAVEVEKVDAQVAQLPPVPRAKPSFTAAAPALTVAQDTPFKAPPADVKPIDMALFGPADVPAGPKHIAAGPALSPPGVTISAATGEVLIARSATGDAAADVMAENAVTSATALPPPGRMAGALEPRETVAAVTPAVAAPAVAEVAAPAPEPLAVASSSGDTLTPMPGESAPAAAPVVAAASPVLADARGSAPGPHAYSRARRAAWDEQVAAEDLPIGTHITPGAYHAGDSDAVANIEAIENGGAPGDLRVADARPAAPAPHLFYRARPVYEDCRPYTRRVAGGMASGTACAGPDGVWRVRSEGPAHAYRRPVVTASLY